jgi:predicted MFS family arabinose efflux permease
VETLPQSPDSPIILSEMTSPRSPSFAVLVAVRAIACVAAAAISVMAYTIIGDALPYRERRRLVSITSTGISKFAIASVPLGFWLSRFWSLYGALWTLAMATLATAGILAFGVTVLPAATQAARPRTCGLLAETRQILAVTGAGVASALPGLCRLGLVCPFRAVDLRSVWH